MCVCVWVWGGDTHKWIRAMKSVLCDPTRKQHTGCENGARARAAGRPPARRPAHSSQVEEGYRSARTYMILKTCAWCQVRVLVS